MSSSGAPNRIAVLGWGSLIWDRRLTFDCQVGAWSAGGPKLPLEFSRISSSRANALTLVIDEELGCTVPSLYTISRRVALSDAIVDLRQREGTSKASIGFIDRVSSEEHGRCGPAVEAIRRWAEASAMDSVIWTDLEPNFPVHDHVGFPEAALNHLKALPNEGIQRAVEYISNAPPHVETRLRIHLMNDSWFKARISEIVPAHG